MSRECQETPRQLQLIRKTRGHAELSRSCGMDGSTEVSPLQTDPSLPKPACKVHVAQASLKPAVPACRTGDAVVHLPIPCTVCKIPLSILFRGANLASAAEAARGAAPRASGTARGGQAPSNSRVFCLRFHSWQVCRLAWAHFKQMAASRRRELCSPLSP